MSNTPQISRPPQNTSINGPVFLKYKIIMNAITLPIEAEKEVYSTMLKQTSCLTDTL